MRSRLLTAQLLAIAARGGDLLALPRHLVGRTVEPFQPTSAHGGEPRPYEHRPLSDESKRQIAAAEERRARRARKRASHG
jgi:hypothetical protein